VYESSIPAQDRVVHIFTKSTIMASKCDKSPTSRKMFIFMNGFLNTEIKLKINTSTLTRPLTWLAQGLVGKV